MTLPPSDMLPGSFMTYFPLHPSCNSGHMHRIIIAALFRWGTQADRTAENGK